MTGLDTGFFVRLLQGDRRAVEFFERVDDDVDLCISSLTLFELRRLALKGVLAQEAVTGLIDNITVLAHIAWLDNGAILEMAAGLSHGLGIPAVDSLILAGFLANGSDTIYTTDSHMERYSKKGVRVIRL